MALFARIHVAYIMGVEQTVSVRSPRLPARNSHASLCAKVRNASARRMFAVLTLRGFERVNMVTSGMYMIARAEPPAQILKYMLRNQFASDRLEFRRKSQKHSSVDENIYQRQKAHEIETTGPPDV